MEGFTKYFNKTTKPTRPSSKIVNIISDFGKFIYNMKINGHFRFRLAWFYCSPDQLIKIEHFMVKLKLEK